MTNTAVFSTQQCAMVHIYDVNTDILNPLFSILDLSNQKNTDFYFQYSLLSKIVSIFYGLLWRRFGLIEFIGEKGWGTKVHSNTEEGMREEKKNFSTGKVFA